MIINNARTCPYFHITIGKCQNIASTSPQCNISTLKWSIRGRNAAMPDGISWQTVANQLANSFHQ